MDLDIPVQLVGPIFLWCLVCFGLGGTWRCWRRTLSSVLRVLLVMMGTEMPCPPPQYPIGFLQKSLGVCGRLHLVDPRGTATQRKAQPRALVLTGAHRGASRPGTQGTDSRVGEQHSLCVVDVELLTSAFHTEI